jgi:Fe-S oxidoreductase
MGVYEAPREFLHAIPGVDLVEMENTREFSACCGTSCWTNCNRTSKRMQISRLKEAEAVGVGTLVTSCWECAIHFRCATRPEAWKQVSLEIRDLIELVAALAR